MKSILEINQIPRQEKNKTFIIINKEVYLTAEWKKQNDFQALDRLQVSEILGFTEGIEVQYVTYQQLQNK